jgi:hypothetical protein
LMVNPPKEGEPSYELYKQEWDGIFAGLQKRATALYEAFEEMEGVEIDTPQVTSANCVTKILLISAGLHVPFPNHPHSSQSRRSCEERGSLPG